MAKFIYEARDQNGKRVNGSVNAASSREAAAQLRRQDLTPIRIREGGSARPQPAQGSSGKRAKKNKAGTRSSQSESIWNKQLFQTVKAQEMSMFCRQMASLLKSGIPLYQALMRVTETTKNQLLHRVLSEIMEEIQSGTALSDALEHYPKIFTMVFVNVCRTGEQTGNLYESFSYLSQYTAMEANTRKKIFAALRYPAIVMSGLIAAIVVLNYVVVPAFSAMYKNFDQPLPLVTRFLIGLSDFMVENGVFLLLGIIATIIGLVLYFRTPKGRYLLDKYKLKVPVFGYIMFRLQMSRFARIFGTMVRSGIPMVNAMELVAKALDNAYLERVLFEVRDKLEEGISVTEATTQSRIFSPLTLQMIAVGEETANIDNMLFEVASFYEAEVDYDLDRLNELLQPFLLVVMGGMVLVVALGIFLPMWNMTSFA